MLHFQCMRKKILSLVLGFSVLFISLSVAGAQNKLEGPYVNKELFAAGDSIKVAGTLEGTAFQAGRNLISSSLVNGILFAAGQNVFLDGQSEYLFSAGNIVSVKGQVAKDAFLAGATILADGATFGRDVYGAGETLSLSGNFARNVMLAGNIVTLSGNYEGSVVVEAVTIEVLEGTNIKGELRYNENASIKIGDNTNIASKSTFISKAMQSGKDTTKTLFLAKLGGIAFSFGNALVLGLLIIWLFPALFRKLSETNNKNSFVSVAKRFGVGFLVLIAAPVLFVLGLVTVVGISSAFVLLMLFVILMIASKTFVGYLLGREVLLKGFKKSKAGSIVSLLLGLAILFLLSLIPVAGGIIGFIVLCLGLGLGFNLIFCKKKKVESIEG